MRYLKCNLQPERHEEVLGKFWDYPTQEEEDAVHDLFTPHVFFDTSGNEREAWATCCRQHGIIGKRGPKHGSEANCPFCGQVAVWNATGKYGEQIRSLRESAHVAFLPADLAHAGAATARLQQQGVEAWYAPFVKQPAAWLREHGARFDQVLLCRHHLAREWLPLVRRYAPQARIVFDSIDLHYLREERGAQVNGDAAVLRQAQATRERELDVVRNSDITVVVSATEKELLQQSVSGARIEVLSNIHRLSPAVAPLEPRSGVLFVGGFRHPPNADAVRWFITEIWPQVHAALPDAVFHCVGADAPAEILALDNVPGVRLHGYVPDLTPLLDACRLSVAPLRFGAGVKGKINQSMAHGLPVVATTCAVEGMQLRDGIDVLIADTAHDVAQAVIRLHGDDALWHHLSHHGRANIAAHFSADAARASVRRLLADG